MKDIVIAICDYYSGIYVNGKLVNEDESIDWEWIAKTYLLDGDATLNEVQIDQEWLEERAHLPENLSDVQTEA
jgi:hypothetical protein